MPKTATELTALQVKAKSKTAGRHPVGRVKGLYLLVAGNGKSWVLRVKIGNRRCDIGLGSYDPKIGVKESDHSDRDGLSLAEAWEKAGKLRAQIRDGIDPLEERRQARVAARVETAKLKTFDECATAYVEANKSEWKNEKHVKQWTATLNTYARPVIGSLPVASVDIGHIHKILDPIWDSKNETASRLRGRIETVLNWAKVRGYREGENPAAWKGNLEHSLSKRQKLTRGHHASLPYPELGSFMAHLRKRDGISARALEFSILTVARSGEVRNATWAEIDLNAHMWVIPKERMKAGKEHHVPLSSEAVALLKALPRVKGTEHLFPAPRGGAMSDMALTAVLKRMDRLGLTQHGFRATFRDWAGERTAHPREVIEHALAHQLADKAEAAYQRGTLLPKRARLMADWAVYCGVVEKSGGNVVGINQGAAA